MRNILASFWTSILSILLLFWAALWATGHAVAYRGHAPFFAGLAVLFACAAVVLAGLWLTKAQRRSGRVMSFLGMIALALVLPRTVRAQANDQGINSRFYAFTNANLGPATTNKYVQVPGAGSTNVTIGINTNYYEHRIDRGRGVALFQVIVITNAIPAGATMNLTNQFDFSPFGSGRMTNSIQGANANWFPFGSSTNDNYTTGNPNTDGAFNWVVNLAGMPAGTNLVFTNVSASLIDNARTMRWTLAATTLTTTSNLLVTPPLVSQFP